MIALALDVTRQGAIGVWKYREEEKNIHYWVVVVAVLNHDRHRFPQKTQRLLQILSEHQFLTDGNLEEFL